MRDIHPIQPVHSFLLTKIIILSKLEQEIFRRLIYVLSVKNRKMSKRPPTERRKFRCRLYISLPTNGKRPKRRESSREDEERKKKKDRKKKNVWIKKIKKIKKGWRFSLSPGCLNRKRSNGHKWATRNDLIPRVQAKYYNARQAHDLVADCSTCQTTHTGNERVNRNPSEIECSQFSRGV